MKKPIKILGAAILMAGSMSVSAFATSEGVGTVDATELNFRTDGSLEAEVIELAPTDASVIILDSSSDEFWSKVYYDGKTGYMATEYLIISESGAAEFGKAVCCGEEIVLRSAPDSESDIMTNLEAGAVAEIIGVEGEWYYISSNDYYGYIHSDNIDLDAQIPVDESSSADGEAAVQQAMEYLGVPYVYGGTSPSGFDCSGLVYYIYTSMGYSVNRTAASLMSNGTEVVDELQAGDLVFFANGGGGSVGHVGIYISDGDFVHAASGSGQVRISNLDESYYAGFYCGARRISE